VDEAALINNGDQGKRVNREQSAWRSTTETVAGTELNFIEGGSGPPLLVLHEELGHPGWLNWHKGMAAIRQLIIPLHPGFGVSPRVDWLMTVGDLAGFYGQVLKEKGFGPVDVIGFSLGGWVAAEMAARNEAQFRRMALVAPAGIRPPAGEILDMYASPTEAYHKASVKDPTAAPEFAKLYGGEMTAEQFEAWTDAQTETARLAWRPYMFNPSLPHLAGAVKELPTLILWGADDGIIPSSAGGAYQESITGSELVVLDNCGHRPEVEKTAEFLDHLKRFFGQGTSE
jgi:pimeloyl-ACP methyl ester carboxylesterase